MRSHVVTVRSRDRQQWMTIRKANPMMAILACEKRHEDYRDCDREKMYWLADSDEHVGKYQSRTTIITSFCRPIPQGTTPTSYRRMERANHRVYILEAGTQIPSLEQIYAALKRLRFGTLVHPRVAREELERREACSSRDPLPPHVRPRQTAHDPHEAPLEHPLAEFKPRQRKPIVRKIFPPQSEDNSNSQPNRPALPPVAARRAANLYAIAHAPEHQPLSQGQPANEPAQPIARVSPLQRSTPQRNRHSTTVVAPSRSARVVATTGNSALAPTDGTSDDVLYVGGLSARAKIRRLEDANRRLQERLGDAPPGSRQSGRAAQAQVIRRTTTTTTTTEEVIGQRAQIQFP